MCCAGHAHHSAQSVAPLLGEKRCPPRAPVPAHRVHLPLKVPDFAVPARTCDAGHWMSDCVAVSGADCVAVSGAPVSAL